jgi:hypothetical protein
MSNLGTLEDLDVDGSPQETASRVDSATGDAFLRRAGVRDGDLAGGALEQSPATEPEQRGIAVEYRLVTSLGASTQHLAAARRALPEHWRTDPRREARIINEHWVRVLTHESRVERVQVGDRLSPSRDLP